ncbi:MAG: DegT/DnrJ/EryC1/StrS family aminotransferase [Candidatus Omnitrophica bacterium]|nr:DegT/DnrJ/EryC1/StrS family aminotransferase [Candidatus Omnitrophota bacterium]
MRGKLAVLGGEPVIPAGMIKPWPPIDDIDRQYVLNSLEGNAHSFGPNCVELEKEFAAWNGNKFAITTNSGTAALHMAVAACGCGAGDEVIVPAYSWSSSATCVLHHNCIPVFVDIEWATMNIDVEKIEAAITEKTKAIIVVHLHGLPVNLEKVLALAKKYNLKIIEDACQAHGATFKGKKVGLLGDCAAFSFNQNKCLCSGEGGMLVTDNEEIYRAARMIWSFGETRTPVESRDYHAYALGWMYRNNDLTAAFGRSQLKKLDQYLAAQQENAAVLLEEIRNIPGLVLPVEPPGYKHNWYNFTVRVEATSAGYDGQPDEFRDKVLQALQAEGVPVGIYQRFILPRMTVFQARNAYGRGCPWDCPWARKVVYDPDDFPVAEKHARSHFGMTYPLRLPNGPEVARQVGEAFRKVFDQVSLLRDVPLKG